MRPALRFVSGEASGSSYGGAHHGTNPGNGAKHVSTILVVEDDVLVRIDIAGHLRDSGYRVLEAAHAEEARDILRGKEPIEIVFSDINLPGQWKGTDLARWLRREFPDVKVILTSGETWFVGNDCDIFVAKPYRPDEVAAHIKRLLDL
jgi:CheY-like chemotaxis protein